MLERSLSRPFLALFVALTLAWSSNAIASPPPSLSTDVYGRLPNIEMMQLSPSGERLAYVVVSDEHRQLVVKDLAGKAIFEASVGDNKVRAIDWAGEDHVLVTVSVTHAFFGYHDEFAHMVVLNLATRKSFAVFANDDAIMHATFGYHGAVNKDGHWYGYVGGATLNKTRGFDASFNENSFIDLYRVDLDSGESELAATGQQRPHNWALTADGTVVAHSEYMEKTGDWSLTIGTEGGATLATLKAPLDDVNLVGLGRTPRTVVIDKATPEEWSLEDGVHTLLPADGLIDGYLFDPATRRLVGVTLAGDRSEQQFYEPVLKARQMALRKAIGPTVWLTSWSADFRRLVLHTDGDGDAGTYWLVDGKSVKPIGYDYPEIPDANVGATRAVSYKAADGLEIHGILTLPPGRDAKALPLVVLPHGGPQAHDTLGFNWWAQAFAGRGYAVFQPNFRGSDGYGLTFRDAGFGQWGRKMQTDISDGVAELAREGVVDSKRACIVGGSYGGYAAVAGVTVQQGLYRCAVSYGGVFDLNYFLNWETPDDRNATARFWFRFLGARSNDDPSLHDLSPARLAERADAPILLIHGADDTVVPIGQSREMERVLRHAGKPVEFILLKGEDHWLSQDATRKAMLSAAVGFVEKYNPAD